MRLTIRLRKFYLSESLFTSILNGLITSMRKLLIGASFLFALNGACGQEKAPDMTMDFEEYDPPSTLVVPEHIITKAKFPFIDVHNHQFGMTSQNLSDLASQMDKLNMAVMVNLR